MNRTEIAHAAFWGTYPALVSAYNQAHAYTHDGQTYPANGFDLRELTAWVATLDADQLAALTADARPDHLAAQPAPHTLRARAATAWAAELARRDAETAAEEAARVAEERAEYEANAATLAEQVAQYDLSDPVAAQPYTPAELRAWIAPHPASLYAGAMLQLDGLVFGYTYYAGLHLLDQCPDCGGWRTGKVRLRPGDLVQLGALLESPAWERHICPTEDDYDCPF
jgi:hypothetical protein